MARRVVALMVGIDNYPAPVRRLWGCVNDIRHAGAFLKARVGEALDLATLLDAQATRQGLIDTFRAHLGKAGADDVALFWFSGHGTEEPAPDAVKALEPSGTLQSLVCYDTGRRIDKKLTRSLADKELALLIHEVAAKGAHVTVVLDCCHSGGGTRDVAVGVRQWIPDPALAPAADRALVAAMATARSADEFISGAVPNWGELSSAFTRESSPVGRLVDHVALSACQSFQTAKEMAVEQETRGAFSVALLGALEAAGPRVTYRDLLAAVRSRVERAADNQTPVLFPVATGGPADRLFLGGSIDATAATFTVTRGADGWAVDAGSVHGLRAPQGAEAFVLACSAPDGTAAGPVKVVSVGVSTSRVEPIGWEPADTAYRSIVASTPLPPATVSFDAQPADASASSTIGDIAPEAHALLREALATAGPGRTPSPHVREGAPGDAVHLRVAAYRTGFRIPPAIIGGREMPAVENRHPCFRILRADGTPLTDDVSGLDREGAVQVIARLEHIARWEQIRGLAGQPSPLAAAVMVKVYEALPGEQKLPEGRAPLALEDGGYRLAYSRPGATWENPAAFMTLTNTTDQDLWVALLDLTDRFGCTSLFPADRLARGHTVGILDGARLDVKLPQDRDVRSGARARDWLMVIVSNVEFSSAAFDLPELGEPATRGVGPVGRARSTLERLAGRALTRGGDDDAAAPASVWSATTIPLTTVVP